METQKSKIQDPVTKITDEDFLLYANPDEIKKKIQKTYGAPARKAQEILDLHYERIKLTSKVFSRKGDHFGTHRKRGFVRAIWEKSPDFSVKSIAEQLSQTFGTSMCYADILAISHEVQYEKDPEAYIKDLESVQSLNAYEAYMYLRHKGKVKSNFPSFQIRYRNTLPTFKEKNVRWIWRTDLEQLAKGQSMARGSRAIKRDTEMQVRMGLSQQREINQKTQRDVSAIREALEAMRGDIASMKEDIASLRS